MSAFAHKPGRCGMPSRGGLMVGCALAATLAAAIGIGPAAADDPDVSGVFLPVDRVTERKLDRARRLFAESRWSDAVAVVDEVLESPRDAFGGAGRSTTARSLKAEAAALMRGQPRQAIEAYHLLFAARAERALDEAVLADDIAGIVAVARRWFDTPAGRRAAVIVAVMSLESGSPDAASAWLERLAQSDSAESLGGTLTALRAVARQRAGSTSAAATLLEGAAAGGRVRVGGRDLQLSMPRGAAAGAIEALVGPPLSSRAPGDWRQPRGEPGRNAVVDASRPLLVPRFRVPLARHPEEARLLEKRRQVFAAQSRPLMPAGGPLAVDGFIVLQTPLGLLAVDFASGKRIWLRPAAAVPSTAGDLAGDALVQAAVERVFDDATGGGLAAAEGLVFAVEGTPPIQAKPPLDAGFAGRLRRDPAPQEGNALTAYDLAGRGAVRWRLPAAGTNPWYLGAPLVVGRELYVLVEERGEIRLDVLDATRGAVVWSQPLAELDEDESTSGAAAWERRLAGLSPALGEGVLVCPLGAGAVVALDLATRTLLWAHRYPRLGGQAAEAMAAQGDRAPRRPGGEPRDALPLICDGRVLLAPPDSAELLCVGLHDGKPLWAESEEDVLFVAGAVGGRAIVVGRRGLAARALADGEPLWTLSYEDLGGRPSGRGILTPASLLLPLDSPEIVEIDLAEGVVVGRCPARGGGVPGNLVAYRGEVISRGIDSLDVFHQAAVLEARIQTAVRDQPSAAWPLQWQGQLDLEAGRVAEGLGKLREAARDAGHRMPPSTLADAVVFGMRRDFAAAAPAWRDVLAADRGGSPAETTLAVMQTAIDGFIRRGVLPEAWAAMREWLDNAVDPEAGVSVRDPADAALVVAPNRWFAARWAELEARADPPLREEMNAAASAGVAAAAETGDPTQRVRRLEGMISRLGRSPAAAAAREQLLATLAGGDPAAGDGAGDMMRQRERHLLALLRSGDDGQRETAATALAAEWEGRSPGFGTGSTPPSAHAWPLGRVTSRVKPVDAGVLLGQGQTRRVPLPVDVDRPALVADLALAGDIQEGRLHLLDGCGRPVGQPLVIEAAGVRQGMPWLPQATGFEAATHGRLLVVRTGGAVSVYDLVAGGGRPLWTRATSTATGRESQAGFWGRALGGRGDRAGSIPLGLVASEPEGRTTAPARGALVRGGAVLHEDGGSLAAHDPFTGAILWERHRMPPTAELIGDDEFVCACTADGSASRVLSMLDGRLVRQSDLPPRRRRLATHGRLIVAVRPLGDESGQAVVARVRLELVDPVAPDPIVLGEVPGGSRGVATSDGRVLVLTPDGALIAFDLEAGRQAFKVDLPEMPPAFDRLLVLPWEDRYLVVAGSQHAAPESVGGFGEPATLQHMLASGEATPPLSGAIWAVDRSTGQPLWPSPALIDRHCLHVSQPAALPILLLSRQAATAHDQVRLTYLCLDKRTGHAALEEDALPIQSHLFFGCELAGDPERHSITIREFGGTPRHVVMEFTGSPMPPRPPYRDIGPRAGRGAGPHLDRLLEQLEPQPRERP